MAQVTIHIGGRAHIIACRDGEEDSCEGKLHENARAATRHSSSVNLIGTIILVLTARPPFLPGLNFQRMTASVHSWRVDLDEHGDTRWTDEQGSTTKTPASFGRRTRAAIGRMLPIESQL